MAIGDTTGDSIIWVPGEATGKNAFGESTSVPTDSISTAIAAGITVSGGVPSGAPSGLPLQFDSSTRVLYAWTGSTWVTVSGGL